MGEGGGGLDFDDGGVAVSSCWLCLMRLRLCSSGLLVQMQTHCGTQGLLHVQPQWPAQLCSCLCSKGTTANACALLLSAQVQLRLCLSFAAHAGHLTWSTT
jgi:hypothetical protein